MVLRVFIQQFVAVSEVTARRPRGKRTPIPPRSVGDIRTRRIRRNAYTRPVLSVSVPAVAPFGSLRVAHHLPSRHRPIVMQPRPPELAVVPRPSSIVLDAASSNQSCLTETMIPDSETNHSIHRDRRRRAYGCVLSHSLGKNSERSSCGPPERCVSTSRT